MRFQVKGLRGAEGIVSLQMDATDEADATRQAVARAPSVNDALATVFASPEFQRR